jgi:hypothetical protein
MKRTIPMLAVPLFALSVSAFAADTEHRLGEHPAVIAKRMYDKQGYDYASKFYRHPAGYDLYSVAPSDADAAHVKVARAPATPAVQREQVATTKR